MKWKVGDKVRLTGGSWPSYESKVQRGTYHTVSGVNGEGSLVEFEGNSGVKWLICNGWEIELVEREEETMSVDFSEVNVGDKVRLTRENGDETTFTVTNNLKGMGTLSGATNHYSEGDWDTLEIVERAFKPVPGLYSNHRTGDVVAVHHGGDSYYKASGGVWVTSSLKIGMSGKAAREAHGWKREITF